MKLKILIRQCFCKLLSNYIAENSVSTQNFENSKNNNTYILFTNIINFIK